MSNVQAIWSDRFFNYHPAREAYAKACAFDQSTEEQRLSDAAIEFQEMESDCPCTADELVADFLSRV